MRKKILFVSWQGAMGHVTRDLAIAQEIHSPDFFRGPKIPDELERKPER